MAKKVRFDQAPKGYGRKKKTHNTYGIRSMNSDYAERSLHTQVREGSKFATEKSRAKRKAQDLKTIRNYDPNDYEW